MIGFVFRFCLILGLFELVYALQIQSNLLGLGTQNGPTPSPLVYKSYQTTIYCTPSDSIKFPTSQTEVQKIVLDAINNNQTVKAFGSRHSITDTICTDGIPVSMNNINYTILNNDGTATFGAGIEMIDALKFLEQNTRTLIHVPAFGGITVGGAIGTEAHGSSLLHPTSISDQVVGLTIVDGTGTIRTISSVSSPDDIKAFRVHLGLLGIIIDITVSTVPLFKMTIQNTLQPESILFDGTAIQWAHEYDWFQMWWFPTSQDVVVSKGTYTTDLTTPGNASTNLIPDEDPATIIAGEEGFELLQQLRNKPGLYAFEQFTKLSLYQQVVGKPPIFTEDGVTVVNPAVGYGWRLQANKCTNKCAWDNGNASILPEESSMAFNISELTSVIQTIKDVRLDIPAAFEMIGVFIRFSRASDGLMAISSGRETASVEWTTPMRHDSFNTARDSVGAYQAILQAMLQNHGGRPHWGKNGLYFHSKDAIAQTNPNLQAFIAAMNKFDPNGVFMNKFGARVRGQANNMDIDPSVTHCALQDYCVCTTNGDCAPLQRCTNHICRDILNINFPPLPFYDPANLTSILIAIGL